MNNLSIHNHFMLYKPYGYLSQFASNSNQQQNKKFLGDFSDFPANSMPIGRLDEDSEGLLLITTNGKLCAFINMYGIEKEYFAQVDGNIDEKAILSLCQGVEIGKDGCKYLTKSCKVFKLIDIPSLPIRKKKVRDERHGPTSWISITITEGKKRQVRKMTSAVGYPTLRLVRVRVGTISIGNLDNGNVKNIDLSQLTNEMNDMERDRVTYIEKCE